MNRLYILSSLFHVLMATGHSLHTKDGKSRFVFLDWTEQNLAQIIPCLMANLSLSKRDILIVDGHRSRKKSSQRIVEFAREHGVGELYTGNDRHLELQYTAYHLKQEQELLVTYLDEGLFTYEARASSQKWSEKVFDQLVKKIYYGRWWQTPDTIGASKYVDRCVVLFPDQVNHFLKKKPCIKFNAQVFASESMRSFASCWLNKEQQLDGLGYLSYVFAIPDEKDFRVIEGYRDYLVTIIGTLLQQGKKVAIKYHPNARNRDLLGLAAVYPNLQLLPSGVPFELLALQLSAGTRIVAEFSTILLTSKLVNPQLHVTSVWFDKESSRDSAARLAGFLDVETLHYQALLNEVMLD